MTAVQAPTDSCHPNTDTMSAGEAARNLMAGRYKLGHHPLVSLGQRPSWAEDPLHDRNWRERFQMLRFLMALMIEWQDSGDPGIATERSSSCAHGSPGTRGPARRPATRGVTTRPRGGP